MLDGTLNSLASGPDAKLIAPCSEFEGYTREVYQAVDSDPNGSPPRAQKTHPGCTSVSGGLSISSTRKASHFRINGMPLSVRWASIPTRSM